MSSPKEESAVPNKTRELDWERLWWVAALVAGALAAAPFAWFEFLPLVDFPLHQLELKIWLESGNPGSDWARYYETASYWFPYWTTLFVSRPFATLLGVAAAGRVPLALYAFALPLVGGFVARASGRSGFGGLLLCAVFFEFNLFCGFIAYCFGGLLWLALLGLCLFYEKSGSRAALIGQGAVSLALGFTHPQMAVVAFASCRALASLGYRTSLSRRLAMAGCSLPVLLPTAVWLADSAERQVAFVDPPTFLPFFERLAFFDDFTFDVFPGAVDDLATALVAALVAASWVRVVVSARPNRIASWRGALHDHRLALFAIASLAGYFLLPWYWNGQAVAMRFPFLAMLCLPGLLPMGWRMSALPRIAATAIALVAIANAFMSIRGFDIESREQLKPLIDRVPANSRVAYLAYDLRTDWVNGEAWTQAGAWAVFEKGGVYAMHFNRLTSHYTQQVPLMQTMIGREYVFARTWEKKRQVVRVRRGDAPFWNVFIARFARGQTPFNPVQAEAKEITTLYGSGRLGLVLLRDRASKKNHPNTVGSSTKQVDSPKRSASSWPNARTPVVSE